MAKITSFTRANLRQLDAEMLAALEQVCKPYGLKVNVAGGNFSEFEFTARFKIAIASPEADKSKTDKEENAWRLYAPMVGLKAEWFGREFQSGRNTFKIAGYMPGRSKYSVLAVRADGKRILFPAETIRLKFDTERDGKRLATAR